MRPCVLQLMHLSVINCGLWGGLILIRGLSLSMVLVKGLDPWDFSVYVVS
jgi:hypothetical protein